MIDGAFVIDGVAHGYHFAPENSTDPERAEQLTDQLYELTAASAPEGWMLEKERWLRATDPDLVARALFAESATDAAIYHHVPIFGLFEDGGSPLWVGADLSPAYAKRLERVRSERRRRATSGASGGGW